MNDLPVFLQVFFRAFALLTVGLWLQTLSSSEKKEQVRPPESAKSAPITSPATRPADQPLAAHGQPRLSSDNSK